MGEGPPSGPSHHVELSAQTYNESSDKQRCAHKRYPQANATSYQRYWEPHTLERFCLMVFFFFFDCEEEYTIGLEGNAVIQNKSEIPAFHLNYKHVFYNNNNHHSNDVDDDDDNDDVDDDGNDDNNDDNDKE